MMRWAMFAVVAGAGPGVVYAGDGSVYDIYRTETGTALGGSNYETGSRWSGTYLKDGSMHGVDKNGRFWHYTPPARLQFPEFKQADFIGALQAGQESRLRALEMQRLELEIQSLKSAAAPQQLPPPTATQKDDIAVRVYYEVETESRRMERTAALEQECMTILKDTGFCWCLSQSFPQQLSLGEYFAWSTRIVHGTANAADLSESTSALMHRCDDVLLRCLDFSTPPPAAQ